jgi:hypothetical protein
MFRSARAARTAASRFGLGEAIASLDLGVEGIA